MNDLRFNWMVSARFNRVISRSHYLSLEVSYLQLLHLGILISPALGFKFENSQRMGRRRADRVTGGKTS
jgi:hypothetical protein